MNSMLFVMPTQYQQYSFNHSITHGEPDTLRDPGRDVLDEYRYVNLIRPTCWGRDIPSRECFIYTQ